MKARLIVQTNNITGQKNVVFTQDTIAPLEDFLVSAWTDSKVLTGTVLLLTLDNDILVERLFDTELHSVDDTGEGGTISPEMCQKLLEGVILDGNS